MDFFDSMFSIISSAAGNISPFLVVTQIVSIAVGIFLIILGVRLQKKGNKGASVGGTISLAIGILTIITSGIQLAFNFI